MRARKVNFLGQISPSIDKWKALLIWMLNNASEVLTSDEFDHELAASINRQGITTEYIGPTIAKKRNPVRLNNGWFVDTSHSKNLAYDVISFMTKLFNLKPNVDITLNLASELIRRNKRDN